MFGHDPVGMTNRMAPNRHVMRFYAGCGTSPPGMICRRPPLGGLTAHAQRLLRRSFDDARSVPKRSPLFCLNPSLAQHDLSGLNS
jgi:hypothetical protein